MASMSRETIFLCDVVKAELYYGAYKSNRKYLRMAIAVAGILKPKRRIEVRKSDRVSMGVFLQSDRGYFSMNPPLAPPQRGTRVSFWAVIWW